jgi:hypothetical protein
MLLSTGKEVGQGGMLLVGGQGGAMYSDLSAGVGIKTPGSIWRKVKDRLQQRRDRKKEPDLDGAFWSFENGRREACRLRDMG